MNLRRTFVSVVSIRKERRQLKEFQKQLDTPIRPLSRRTPACTRCIPSEITIPSTILHSCETSVESRCHTPVKVLLLLLGFTLGLLDENLLPRPPAPNDVATLFGLLLMLSGSLLFHGSDINLTCKILKDCYICLKYVFRSYYLCRVMILMLVAMYCLPY